MHTDEVAQVASHLVTSLGLQWDAADFSALSAAIGTFRYFIISNLNYIYHYKDILYQIFINNDFERFPTFLAVLESKYSGGRTLDNIALTEAIDDLYQIYIENVVKKVRYSLSSNNAI